MKRTSNKPFEADTALVTTTGGMTMAALSESTDGSSETLGFWCGTAVPPESTVLDGTLDHTGRGFGRAPGTIE